MPGWVIHAAIIIAGITPVGSRAVEYIRAAPPMPDQSAIICHDAQWEQATLTTVNGAAVHTSLAPFIHQIRNDAQRDGHTLTLTSAYRTCGLQNQLRANSCGTGQYNMTLKPISECAPPTEPAGRSLHNEGLAVDFACQGYSFFAKSPCYQWLKYHAFKYHLLEHELEAWHWSTTGK
jgi:LAS superfamily LD-carboxypeptidase LdcB